MKIYNFRPCLLLLIIAVFNFGCEQTVPKSVIKPKLNVPPIIEKQPPVLELKAIFRTNIQLPIKSNIAGTIESLPLSESSIVQKGQIIVQLNNGISFKKLLDSKHILKLLIEQTLENLPESLKNQVSKWNSFKMKLNPADLIPSLPPFNSENEEAHFTNQGLFYAYNELVAADKEMDNYFILAPQDGQLKISALHIGLELKKNQKIGSVKKQVAPFIELSTPLKNNVIDTFDIIYPSHGSIGKCISKNGKLNSFINLPTFSSMKNGTAVLLRQRN